MLVGRDPWESLSPPSRLEQKHHQHRVRSSMALPSCVLKDGLAPPPWWHVPQLHHLPRKKKKIPTVQPEAAINVCCPFLHLMHY